MSKEKSNKPRRIWHTYNVPKNPQRKCNSEVLNPENEYSCMRVTKPKEFTSEEKERISKNLDRILANLLLQGRNEAYKDITLK